VVSFLLASENAIERQQLLKFLTDLLQTTGDAVVGVARNVIEHLNNLHDLTPLFTSRMSGPALKFVVSGFPEMGIAVNSSSSAVDLFLILTLGLHGSTIASTQQLAFSALSTVMLLQQAASTDKALGLDCNLTLSALALWAPPVVEADLEPMLRLFAPTKPRETLSVACSAPEVDRALLAGTLKTAVGSFENDSSVTLEDK